MIQEIRATVSDMPGLKSTGFIALMIGMVGVILRAWRVTSSPLWYDEAFTAILARLPLRDLLAAIVGDVHPPLYYLVSHNLGPDGLRLLSVILSVVAMGVFWSITSSLAVEARARLIALALFAFAAPQLWYAGEARMYALLELLILNVWLNLIERRWPWVAVWSILALYTHSYAALYLAVLAIVALYHEVHRPRNFYVAPATGPQPEGAAETAQLLGAFGVAGLAYSPWFIGAQLNQMGSLGGHWTASVNPLNQFASLISVVFGRAVTGGLQVMAVIVMAAAIPLLLVWARRNKRLSVAMVAFCPALLVVAISVIWKPIYLIRGLLPSMPAIYILLAEVLSHAPVHRRLVILGVILPLFAAGTIGHIGLASVGSLKYDPMAYRTNLVVTPGVPVVHLSDFSLVTWMASRPELEQYLYDSGCGFEPGSLSNETRSAMGIEVITELPERYTLVAGIGAMSNQCQESVYQRLTGQANAVYFEFIQYGETGVWFYER